jgi:hypothetical protein
VADGVSVRAGWRVVVQVGACDGDMEG